MSTDDGDVLMPRDQDFLPVTNDVFTTGQFWECQNCHAIVLDWIAHDEWHLRTT